MNINAIYKKAVNNGYEVKTVTTNSGKYAIIVEGWNTPDFYNCIHSIYRKCNVHIDFHYATKSACIMDIADYEREKAEKKLLMKLQEAEEAVKDESAWMSLDELKRSVGV